MLIELKFKRLDRNSLAIAETYYSIVGAFLREDCDGGCEKCKYNSECEMLSDTIKKMRDSLIEKGVFE